MSKLYNVIYADPPWAYKSRSGRDFEHGAEKKYSVMTNEDIAAMPVPDITAANAVCFLWITNPLLPTGLSTLECWGFRYKTCITWRKVMSLGMGFWFRGQTEHLLLGVKGKVKPFRCQKPNFHQSKVGKHSQKPHYFRELISEVVKTSFPEPAKLELFARSRKDMFPDYEYEDGWDVYGNEVNNSIMLNQKKE